MQIVVFILHAAVLPYNCSGIYNASYISQQKIEQGCCTRWL